MASRNKQETCHGPDTSILHSQTLEAASPFALSRAVFARVTAGWGIQSNMTMLPVRTDSSHWICSSESDPGA